MHVKRGDSRPISSRMHSLAGISVHYRIVGNRRDNPDIPGLPAPRPANPA